MAEQQRKWRGPVQLLLSVWFCAAFAWYFLQFKSLFSVVSHLLRGR